MGKSLIFRWSYVHHITKKVVRARKRPFPLLIDDETGEVQLAVVEKKTTPKAS